MVQRRFRVREARIGIALAGGDPDELIEVRRHDLKTPGDYLEIVQTLAAAERVDEAVQWARQGLDRFADRSWQTPPLREFVAGLLREQDQGDQAVELFWTAFQQAATLPAYRRLLDQARIDADVWKERTILDLRSRLAETRPDDARGRGRPGTSAGLLVEILAYEGEIDAAWDVATTHGCDERLWLALARARENSHPLDAIVVYEREVFAQIDRKKNQAYRAAVDLLARFAAWRTRRASPSGSRPCSTVCEPSTEPSATSRHCWTARAGDAARRQSASSRTGP